MQTPPLRLVVDLLDKKLYSISACQDAMNFVVGLYNFSCIFCQTSVNRRPSSTRNEMPEEFIIIAIHIS